MTDTIAGVSVPDTEIARATTELVRAATNDNVYHHSRRVYFFGMLKEVAKGRQPDPELAYVGAMFHDLGLTERYRSQDERFEVDGAQAAYEFLREHGRNEAEARQVWLAIALHTTPMVPVHLEPEVSVVTEGVEADVLGMNLGLMTAQQRDEVVAAHPRNDFKRRIIEDFYEGMKHRPETAFGTMNTSVLAHHGVELPPEQFDFVTIIEANDWPE